jgi:hypothetical protein
MTTTTYEITGLDPEALAELLHEGVDHAGVAVAPFEDADGGWPLRCCLSSSRIGDRIAIVAFSPYSWDSAYRETGPVVVHVEGCPGPHSGALPPEFDERPLVLRAYGADEGRAHTQVYDLNRLVEPGGLGPAITELLADERVELLQARHPLHGCYAFTARRPG